MEINEKLDIFFEAAIAAANKQSAEILEEQKEAYQQAIGDYEKSKLAGQKTRERAMEAQIRKEANRRVSEQAMLQKRILHEAVEAKKEALFAVVEEKLKDYCGSREYEAFLVRHIQEAKAFAKGEEIVIYLAPTDRAKKERLEQETGVSLEVSEENFIGGIRAVIAAKNILIDESFAGRLRQEKDNYSF